MTRPTDELRSEFGDIDIYLFDQLLRGRLIHGMRVLDAGCGSGRNLVYLLRQGFDVCAVDANPDAVSRVRQLASTVGPSRLESTETERFRVEPVEQLSFADASMDFVISSAVLHFAATEAQWVAMIQAMWRVLAPRGILFARLASTVGQEGTLRSLGNGRYTLPDGSDRFCVDEQQLQAMTTRLDAELLDPIKTSVVHGLRSMATWVVRKR